MQSAKAAEYSFLHYRNVWFFYPLPQNIHWIGHCSLKNQFVCSAPYAKKHTVTFFGIFLLKRKRVLKGVIAQIKLIANEVILKFNDWETLSQVGKFGLRAEELWGALQNFGA